ncbi:ABC transporter ATP-binding protein [Polynucleobacter sp. AP-Sanab-80-C2]|uniref:ABC transporter ATP-binding protein n=1 Tax=Polynucleobacter sp. AP-Sanab-80-C2 TaxID=3108274 RepID=UPI002B237898|nr:ABC transporter ATP-binding protein [Polynucleobacter sp. AP-Sanab-80-C2]MEA9598571.1 ABC transporter ATP-binding protein [Polynucleobacter sp. AP-Sanab-80-C2]
MKMNSNQSIYILLKRLWIHIGGCRRRQFKLLLILMLLTSFSEIISIGSAVPFLGALTSPENAFKLPAAKLIAQILNIAEPKQFLLVLAVIFGLAAILAGGMRLILLWFSNKFSFAVGADLSIEIYRRTLYQSYAIHSLRNSSEIIDGLNGKLNIVIYGIIVPAMTIISSSVMLLFILIGLILMQPMVAIISFGGFGFIYLLIGMVTRKKLKRDSECIASESPKILKSLQESLGGIRDVLIDGSQEVFCKIFRNSDYLLRRAQGTTLFIITSPRYCIEALGMLLIALIAYWLNIQPDGGVGVIPILGAFALGAQRLVPMLQQVYGSWTTINSGQSSLKFTLELLDQPMPDYINKPVGRMNFSNCITLESVGFRYLAEGPQVLEKVNLTIKKGSRVGFIGVTGSGKSTLLDIIMGLLQPTSGQLRIDDEEVTFANNRDWQVNIAHVPQAIFLADATIAENIAFGVPKYMIDLSRVRVAAEKAQLSDDIESWPRNYQTFVGERGIRLSGGQRQRIGIARALYKDADVIILDEATSALDSETEREIMRTIDTIGHEKTVLIVAHRLTTLKNCTKIVQLSKGSVSKIGTYEEIIENS